MKIAIAQLNATVGDLAGNVALIVDFSERARRAGAALVVTPELALCGYPPEDLLLREDFIEACERALMELARQVADIVLVVGHPRVCAGKRYNSASVLAGGRVVATYDKQCLPNYTVFDEERYFEPGSGPCVHRLDAIGFGIIICEDAWGDEGRTSAGPKYTHGAAAGARASAPAQARAAGADILLVLNASPYHVAKQDVRAEVMRARVRETGVPLVYVNLVGGQDELVFDGGSFVLDAQGNVVRRLPLFDEALGVVELDEGAPRPGEVAQLPVTEEEVYRALTTGVRDYLGKSGFPGALIGLSGGIDSALTLTVAVDALGAGRVRAVMMPSQYTADMSLEDARAEADALGVRYSEIAIRPIFDAFRAALAGEFAGLPEDTTEENLQSRIRGTLLMALSNKTGALVLTTGNKSEMGTGYATLYGDMAGGFAVLKDINKLMVYRLARYRNGIMPVIPQRVIDRPPSAELRPDQTDQDSLPPYPVLDAIMEAYVESDLSPREIIARGYSPADVERVVRLVRASEYKRRQAPVGIRITPRGFGKDWRFPITNRFRHRYE